jgi:acyl-CoA synthetase (AMP-forming)/AMP-acid ligase II
VTYTLAVPAIYNRCLLDPDFDRHDLSSWRIGGYGGAPLPEATIKRLAERLADIMLFNAYGATETTGILYPRLLRRAPLRLQGARPDHLSRGFATAQCERQGIEAGIA